MYHLVVIPAGKFVAHLNCVEDRNGLRLGQGFEQLLIRGLVPEGDGRC